MVKLNVEGDWSPRLTDVDLLVQDSPLPCELVRELIESPYPGIRVHYHAGCTRHGLMDCLGGRGATGSVLVLNLGDFTISEV